MHRQLLGTKYTVLALAMLLSTHGEATAGKAFKSLYSFRGGSKGADPFAAPILGTEANALYGTTEIGGKNNSGTIYSVALNGKKGKVLYSFCIAQNCSDGSDPIGALISDSSGNLYGTTASGGQDSDGVVFELSPSGNQTVLYYFTGGTDGATPESNLAMDGSGNLFGTAFWGGNYVTCGNVAYGCGSVFELSTSGVLTAIHDFMGSAGDGANPVGGVIEDSSGNLYGTTEYGGGQGTCNNIDQWNCGTVYEISASGTETLLYSFTGGSDGGQPMGNLIRDSSGNLYGTTFYGGADNAGTIFKTAPGGGETVLFSFNGTTRGAYPFAGLIADGAGNFYGTTKLGGEYGNGVVFELSASGTEQVLYSFCLNSGCPDGAHPDGGVIDYNGYLYGTTYYGGKSNDGTIFRLKLN